MELLIAILIALGIPGFNGVSQAAQKAHLDQLTGNGFYMAPGGHGHDDDGAGRIFICPICMGGKENGAGNRYLHGTGKIETLAVAHGI